MSTKAKGITKKPASKKPSNQKAAAYRAWATMKTLRALDSEDRSEAERLLSEADLLEKKAAAASK